MTKVCVFVPCHLYYNRQVELLNRCLNSLINQTIKPAIYLSISFGDEKYKKEFADIILRNDVMNCITKVYSEKQLFQMEHIYKLTKLYANKYLIIMFCDDDDMYVKYRVEKFVDVFARAMLAFEIQKGIKMMGIKELMHERPEYWCYGLMSDVLTEFFNIFKKYDMLHLLKHKYSDMYLRHYLLKIHADDTTFAFAGIEVQDTKDITYIYNEDNSNSICGSLHTKSTRETNEGSLLLLVLKGGNDIEFADIYKQAIMAVDYFYAEELKNIHKFCKILYK